MDRAAENHKGIIKIHLRGGRYYIKEIFMQFIAIDSSSKLIHRWTSLQNYWTLLTTIARTTKPSLRYWDYASTKKWEAMSFAASGVDSTTMGRHGSQWTSCARIFQCCLTGFQTAIQTKIWSKLLVMLSGSPKKGLSRIQNNAIQMEIPNSVLLCPLSSFLYLLSRFCLALPNVRHLL